MEFVLPSKRQSVIGEIGCVRSEWLQMKVDSMKQCVEPESTKVRKLWGTESEQRLTKRDVGLERAEVFSLTSIVQPELMRPWGAQGVEGH